MDFGFEAPALHDFLVRTRLEPSQVSENLFSTSFGLDKVRHGNPIVSKTHIFAKFLNEIKLLSLHNPNNTKTRRLWA